MHDEGRNSRFAREERRAQPGPKPSTGVSAWRGVVLALGAYIVGCGEEEDEALDGADEPFVLAQETAPPLTNTGYADEGQPVVTALPVKLTNGVTLQSCPGVEIMASDFDPKQLIVVVQNGYALRSNLTDALVEKNCQFHITVTGAVNKRFVTTVVKYSGDSALKTFGAAMKFESEIYWQSKIWQVDRFQAEAVKAYRLVQGGTNGNWSLDHTLKVGQSDWGSSECLAAREESDQLVLNTRLGLFVDPPSDVISTASLQSFTATAQTAGAAVFGIKVDAVDCTPTAN